MSIRPLDSFFCTPSGIKKTRMLTKKDRIFDVFGQPVALSEILPHDPVEFLRLTFDDGRTVDLCENQPFGALYFEEDGGSFQIAPIQTFLDDYRIEVDADQKYLYKYVVPLGRPTNFDPVKVDIHPYIAGIMMNTAITTERQLTCAYMTEELADRVCEICGFRYQYNPDDGKYRFFTQKGKVVKTKKFLKALKIHKVPISDRIPVRQFTLNEPDVILAYLDGLMDSCRYSVTVPKNQFPIYATTSVPQAKTMLFTLRSMGWKVFIEQGTGEVFVHWISPESPLDTNALVLKEIVPIGKKECVSIHTENDDTVYLADDFIPVPISD